jgi:hypothetical protein
MFLMHFILLMLLMLFVIIISLIYKYNVQNNENFGDDFINPDRSDQCSVYIDSFSNAHGNITKNTQLIFYKWCLEYKNNTNRYPTYRQAERVFNSLIYRGVFNL